VCVLKNVVYVLKIVACVLKICVHLLIFFACLLKICVHLAGPKQAAKRTRTGKPGLKIHVGADPAGLGGIGTSEVDTYEE
jgi:hypothetical protein